MSRLHLNCLSNSKSASQSQTSVCYRIPLRFLFRGIQIHYGRRSNLASSRRSFIEKTYSEFVKKLHFIPFFFLVSELSQHQPFPASVINGTAVSRTFQILYRYGHKLKVLVSKYWIVCSADSKTLLIQ